MKPMKLFNSEKNHFSGKTFSNIDQKSKSSNILIFAAFVDYYNTNQLTKEMLIKINLNKALKLNSMDTWFFSELKNFMGFKMN